MVVLVDPIGLNVMDIMTSVSRLFDAAPLALIVVALPDRLSDSIPPWAPVITVQKSTVFNPMRMVRPNPMSSAASHRAEIIRALVLWMSFLVERLAAMSADAARRLLGANETEPRAVGSMGFAGSKGLLTLKADPMAQLPGIVSTRTLLGRRWRTKSIPSTAYRAEPLLVSQMSLDRKRLVTRYAFQLYRWVIAHFAARPAHSEAFKLARLNIECHPATGTLFLGTVPVPAIN